ncbi:DEAD/DEAH box helicase family protein [Treponema denticola]|uniref:TOTE conflict system archaeo-eukaryotic primase domain-containing protein n=1 Tax=Treponema denticola TaxID=158 RepID=UPI0020A56BCD|nr:DEAD/DEAH box helicase family protein [Treponema denticola]UTD13749.1 DEAD/DEAH box helicase family protein [Treponema denticola]
MPDISPVVLSYLKTLSHEELIALIHSFANAHEDIRFTLEEKAAVQTTKNKNEAAADKQQILQTAANALVNRNSTAQEKINLYTSLFVGRQDVFTLRWYNAKSNKSGYSPVCENKWKTGKCDMKKYACAACPFKLHVPLSDRYIFNHLAGKDSTCRDVVGLYPLMEGDVCRFLALDFDSHTGSSDTWKKDAAAVCKTCAAFSIPVSVEISRSGKGAHLWIFFSENISAKRARNLGMLILQAAMNERHSLPFESFDRMFPNQDSIPKGGYGNLIALPLQGQAVKNKYSVFVDEDFIPFNDQWAYLSSVKKLSAKDLETCCIEITKVVHNFLPNGCDDCGINKIDDIAKDRTAYKISGILSNNPINQNKQSNNPASKNVQLTQKDFSSAVYITLSNQIEITKTGISERALGIFRRTAVFLNPEYFKNLHMRLPLYNIPRYIDCSGETENALLLPRGNIDQIQKLLNDCNSHYEITDDREEGMRIEVDFSAELYAEQKAALQAMLKSDIGILSAGTGFGKTVTAAALIAERKTNTIILVQTHTLLEQWKKAVKRFLNYEAGTIATGKDMSTGIIDIAIIKSLTEKNSDAVKPRRHTYGMLIVDECHHVSAFGTENLVKSFRSKYVYGLTATPVRRDGRQKIIFMQCGQILYATTTKQMNRVQNFEHYFIPRFTNFHITAENEENSKQSIQNYYSEMIKAESWNLLIVSDVQTAVKAGRTPLVLSDRIEHLKLLKENLKDAAANVIMITGKGTQKQKKEQLEILNKVPASESLIVLATGKYAGEGFDNPRLDTLMLAMPFSWKGTLAQYCGRLHRNFAGKEEVLIFDYVDFRLPVFDRMYRNRLKGYKQLGYTIKPVFDSGKKEEVPSKLYSANDYTTDFIQDCMDAKKSAILYSPYLSKTEVQKFLPLVPKIISNGCKIFIMTKLHEDEGRRKKQQQYINMLETAGAAVSAKENITQRLAIFDEKILWYGSINFLGYSEEADCSIRICNSEIASAVEAEIIK